MNSIPIRNVTPTPELMAKIRRARDAIAEQKPREVRCPFCGHRLAKIFEDTRGHLETKCAKCGIGRPRKYPQDPHYNYFLTFIVMVGIPTSLSEMVTET